MANVTGLRALQAALRAAQAGHREDVTAALNAAGLYIQAESMDRVPVEYGPLRASADTIVIEKSGAEFVKVITGYKSSYALWVHEATGEVLRGKPRPSGIGPNYWDPSPRAGSKFLESVIRDRREEIRRIIRQRATGQE